MIVNIRGTSGSGKTTAVRSIMAMGATEKVYADEPSLSGLFQMGRTPVGYRVNIAQFDRPLFVVGSYENTCGGCDAIGTQDEICSRVRRYGQGQHLLMEGLLMSHLYSRYKALAEEMQPIPYIWAFLDTPLEVCLERVVARRAERGVAKKEFNPKNTTDKWHDMRRVFAKCQRDGLDARWVDYRDAAQVIYGWLR